MTQMPADLMRGSTLMGVDVYGTDNQKIGDIDEVLIDRQGKIHGVVVGVGGFLGIGEKDVAIPFDQVQWMSNREVQASTGTAGTEARAPRGVTTPGAPLPAAPTSLPRQAAPAQPARPEPQARRVRPATTTPPVRWSR